MSEYKVVAVNDDDMCDWCSITHDNYVDADFDISLHADFCKNPDGCRCVKVEVKDEEPF